ncbi:MAG: hypothetical protein V4795_08150 [Pseudomonadota bacterium]
MLIEAVVGTAVVGLVCAASVYAVGRSANAQHNADLRAQAVEQLANRLAAQGVALCNTSSETITVAGQVGTVSVTCSQQSATVTLPGGGLAPVVLSGQFLIQAAVDMPLLGGRITVSSAGGS